MRYMNILTVAELQGKKPEDLPTPTNEEESNFYAYFGIAIATWQFVEDSLFHIYVQLLRQPFPAQPLMSAAFYSVPSFRVRLDMVNSTVAVSEISTELRQAWSSLYKHAKEKSIRRNKIAHAVVVFDSHELKPQNRLYLRPSIANVNRSGAKAFPTPPKDKVSVKELNEMIIAFDSLLKELQGFQLNIFKYFNPSSQS